MAGNSPKFEYNEKYAKGFNRRKEQLLSRNPAKRAEYSKDFIEATREDNKPTILDQLPQGMDAKQFFDTLQGHLKVNEELVLSPDSKSPSGYRVENDQESLVKAIYEIQHKTWHAARFFGKRYPRWILRDGMIGPRSTDAMKFVLNKFAEDEIAEEVGSDLLITPPTPEKTEVTETNFTDPGSQSFIPPNAQTNAAPTAKETQEDEKNDYIRPIEALEAYDIEIVENTPSSLKLKFKTNPKLEKPNGRLEIKKGNKFLILGSSTAKSMNAFNSNESGIFAADGLTIERLESFLENFWPQIKEKYGSELPEAVVIVGPGWNAINKSRKAKNIANAHQLTFENLDAKGISQAFITTVQRTKHPQRIDELNSVYKENFQGNTIDLAEKVRQAHGAGKFKKLYKSDGIHWTREAIKYATEILEQEISGKINEAEEALTIFDFEEKINKIAKANGYKIVDNATTATATEYKIKKRGRKTIKIVAEKSGDTFRILKPENANASNIFVYLEETITGKGTVKKPKAKETAGKPEKISNLDEQKYVTKGPKLTNKLIEKILAPYKSEYKSLKVKTVKGLAVISGIKNGTDKEHSILEIPRKYRTLPYLEDFIKERVEIDLGFRAEKSFEAAKNFDPKTLDINEAFEIGIDGRNRIFAARATVVQQFQYANELAKKEGYYLRVHSGHRTQREQTYLWNYHLKRREKMWNDPNSEEGEAAREKHASLEEWNRRWIARPYDKEKGHRGSAHQPGAAIDLYAVPLGETFKSKHKKAPHTNVLKKVLTAGNFENYKVEIWHWEVGSLRWARKNGVKLMYPVAEAPFFKKKTETPQAPVELAQN